MSRRVAFRYRAASLKLATSVLAPSLLVALLLLATAVPDEAHALVPRVDRVIDAAASANRSGRRLEALRFQLNLYIGDGPPVAVGELVTHPTGLARLELRASGGLVERHLLLGNQHSAARNARVLLRPREFLPPLFVLQSNSGTVLDAALQTLGVDRSLIGLAPCGDFDCFVIGDPTRAVSRPVGWSPPVVSNPTEAPPDPTPPAQEEETIRLPASREYQASIWVDTSDYSVRQIESSRGAKIVLGPYVTFERVSVPQWWSIEEPGKRPVRFEVESVVAVNASASAFSRTWLMTPENGMTPDGEASPPSTTSGIPSGGPVPSSPPPPVSAPNAGYGHPDDFLDEEDSEFSADPAPRGRY